MSAAADRAREQQIADEWRDWIGRSTEYLRAVCAPPVDPAVLAILRAWDNGSDEKPWEDAPRDKISSGEEEPPGVPAAGKETAA